MSVRWVSHCGSLLFLGFVLTMVPGCSADPDKGPTVKAKVK